MSERSKPEGDPKPPRRKTRETAADRARIGAVVGESYRVDEILGRGAIGAVFGGMHLRLERPIAIKFVDPALVDDPEIRARFKREARIAAQIGSSHVVEVFDYGLSDDGAPYLVMERLEGEDVHARILAEGKLTVVRALRIAKQVCRALGAAHAKGIVHRDLKPENVFLVSRDGEAEFVKVVDFGLSTFVQSDDTRLTRAGQSVGTPLYMAPEQAGARAFDSRVDVYSLGVLIFEMTTGRLPFEAQTLQQLLVALATGTPRSIRDYDPSLPPELDALVKRFTARDPNRRPKTAAAALAEIVALEETLTDTFPSVKRRIASSSPDGLPGELPGEFAEEVSSHLDQMRRTGRLSTIDSPSDGQIQAAPPAAPDSAPAGNGESTERMNRGELAEILSEPKVAKAPRTETQSAPPPRATPSRRRDIVEEDSGIYVGRHEQPELARPDAVTLAPRASESRAARVTRWVLWASLAAFIAAAVLVVLKVMRSK